MCNQYSWSYADAPIISSTFHFMSDNMGYSLFHCTCRSAPILRATWRTRMSTLRSYLLSIRWTFYQIAGSILQINAPGSCRCTNYLVNFCDVETLNFRTKISNAFDEFISRGQACQKRTIGTTVAFLKGHIALVSTAGSLPNLRIRKNLLKSGTNIDDFATADARNLDARVNGRSVVFAIDWARYADTMII